MMQLHLPYILLYLAYHWRDAVTQIFDNYVESDILTRVEVGEPVGWCTRMIVVAKKRWQTPE